MTEAVSQRVGQGDAELITAVRSGDTAAYGELFERHRLAALRLARQLLPGTESEDLVSEAFTKVLIQLREGRGPDLAFRAYLLTAIRRLHVDRIRSTSRVRTTDDESELDQHVEFFDLAAANFERGTAVDAFASLPERWQLVLWHLDVEGQKPADVAPLLGMSANSVSALAYRAREGLRQAYLQHHLADSASGDCRWTTERLGAHVRKGLSNRDAVRVDVHLDNCRRCMGVYLELIEVNSNLSGILAPAVLGAAATGYLTGISAGAAAGASAGAGAGTGADAGIKGLLSTGANAAVESVKVAVAGMGAQGVAAVVVVAALAATGVYGATVGFTNDDNTDKVTVGAKASPTLPGPSTDPAPGPTPVPSDAPTTEPPVGLSPFAFVPVTSPGAAPAVAVAPPQGDQPSSPPTGDRNTPTDPPPTDTPTDPVPTDPVPTDPPPAIGTTDFSFGAGITSINTDTLFQREITVRVAAGSVAEATSRAIAVAAANPVITVKIDFDSAVRFDGVVGQEWKCGPNPGTDVSAMECTLTQSGGPIPDLVFRATGRPAGGNIGADFTVTASHNDDQKPLNDTARYDSGPWPGDIGFGAITVERGSPFSTVTIPVTTTQTEPAAKSLELTLTINFDSRVVLPNSDDSKWDCDNDKLGADVPAMKCTLTQSGSEVPSLVFRAKSSKGAATVAATATISAADNKDPNSTNDTRDFELVFFPDAS